MHRYCRFIAIGLFIAITGVLASAQEPVADRIGAIKQWLAQSKEHLKTYQWIETTVVSVKGEEKSRKILSCYYDVTGTLQKVPQSESPEAKKKFGIRGAIQKNKQEEMSDYMKGALAVVKSYVPPNPDRLQSLKEAGKMSIDLLSGTSVKLHFKGYEKPGDDLTITLDTVKNTVLAIGVSSYLDDPKDVVVLAVKIGTLPDGTGYAGDTTLDGKSKELHVAITNTGYRKAS